MTANISKAGMAILGLSQVVPFKISTLALLAGSFPSSDMGGKEKIPFTEGQERAFWD